MLATAGQGAEAPTKSHANNGSSEQEQVAISITTLEGETFNLSALSSHTVLALKNRLTTVSGFPAHIQRLFAIHDKRDGDIAPEDRAAGTGGVVDLQLRNCELISDCIAFTIEAAASSSTPTDLPCALLELCVMIDRTLHLTFDTRLWPEFCRYTMRDDPAGSVLDGYSQGAPANPRAQGSGSVGGADAGAESVGATRVIYELNRNPPQLGGALSAGCTVAIQGLSKSPGLNGREATVLQRVNMADASIEAYEVKITETGEHKKVKRENLAAGKVDNHLSSTVLVSGLWMQRVRVGSKCSQCRKRSIH
jgi:hypothetical protein